MAWHAPRYDARYGRTSGQGASDCIHRFRPYGGLIAHWTPLQRNDTASFPTLWTQADGTDRWCYGYDWRPFWQVGRA